MYHFIYFFSCSKFLFLRCYNSVWYIFSVIMKRKYQFKQVKAMISTPNHVFLNDLCARWMDVRLYIESHYTKLLT